MRRGEKKGNHKIWCQEAPGGSRLRGLEQPLPLSGSRFPCLYNER